MDEISLAMNDPGISEGVCLDLDLRVRSGLVVHFDHGVLQNVGGYDRVSRREPPAGRLGRVVGLNILLGLTVTQPDETQRTQRFSQKP